jgi:hypothetical protein
VKEGVMTALLAIWTGPLAAAPSVVVPDGCTPMVTVQKEMCVTSVIFDCGGDRLVQDYDQRGLGQQVRYDSEWLFVDYMYLNEGEPVMTMRKLSGSAEMMTTLLRTGSVAVSGKVAMSTGVIRDREYDFHGTAELTGETLTIDGTDYLMARVANDLTLKTGVPGMSFAFDTLIDPGRNLMIQGSWRRESFGGEPEVFPQDVRRITAAGASDFPSVTPEYGCE